MDHGRYPTHTAPINMFAGSRHLSLREAGVHTAGRDMTLSMPSVTVNLTAPCNAMNSADGPPSLNDSPSRPTKRPTASGITRFFRRKKASPFPSEEQHSDLPSVDTHALVNTGAERGAANNGASQSSPSSESSFFYSHGGLSVVRIVFSF